CMSAARADVERCTSRCCVCQRDAGTVLPPGQSCPVTSCPLFSAYDDGLVLHEPGFRHRRKAFTVSVQLSRYNNTTVPICRWCLKSVVLKSKRQMPFTNLAEEIYLCESCGAETKRIIKDR